jgi:hypothetical protein
MWDENRVFVLLFRVKILCRLIYTACLPKLSRYVDRTYTQPQFRLLWNREISYFVFHFYKISVLDEARDPTKQHTPTTYGTGISKIYCVCAAAKVLAAAKTLNSSHLKYGFFGYLKHVDAHIKETIILHNIVMYIEIEASVIFHRAWLNILHNGTSYTFMHIYNTISITIFQIRIADVILRLVLWPHQVRIPPLPLELLVHARLLEDDLVSVQSNVKKGINIYEWRNST